MRALAATGALLAALALVACGSSKPSTTAPHVAAPPPTTTSPSTSKAVPIPPVTGHVLPSTARPQDVIRAWADTLRHGQIAAAARFFALPSIIANGTAPIELRTRADARAFNESLPCGAILTATTPGPHGLIIATFQLTQRPGSGQCGTGVGHTAQTAFRIKRGRIREWLRVAVTPQSGGGSDGTPA
jgi:hypothetical protein